MICRT